MKRFGRLRADSALWLGIALVLFVASGLMTLVITHVVRHPQQEGIELAFNIAPPAQTSVSQIHPPSVQIISDGDNLRLVVLAIDANTVANVTFGPVIGEHVTCNAYGGPIVLDGDVAGIDPPHPFAPRLRTATDTEKLAEHMNVHATADFADVAMAQLASLPDAGASVSIACDLPSTVVRDTFTSRTFVVTVRGFADEEPLDFLSNAPKEWTLDPRSIEVDDADAQEIHVTDIANGDTRMASKFMLPQQLVTAKGAELKYTWIRSRPRSAATSTS